MSSSLTFSATTSTGDVIRCINVSIIDDLVFEESETFTVTVTTTSPRVTLGNNYTTVTITDNEGQYDHDCVVAEYFETQLIAIPTYYYNCHLCIQTSLSQHI